MCNSPTTPMGTGLSHRSNTYTWVLAMGRPIGTEAESLRSTLCRVDQMVVSVGP